MDVAGIEPATPCLQSWEGKTLNALTGVAYTESQLDFRSLKCPEVVPNIPVLDFSHCLRFKMQNDPLAWHFTRAAQRLGGSFNVLLTRISPMMSRAFAHVR